MLLGYQRKTTAKGSGEVTRARIHFSISKGSRSSPGGLCSVPVNKQSSISTIYWKHGLLAHNVPKGQGHKCQYVHWLSSCKWTHHMENIKTEVNSANNDLSAEYLYNSLPQVSGWNYKSHHQFANSGWYSQLSSSSGGFFLTMARRATCCKL